MSKKTAAKRPKNDGAKKSPGKGAMKDLSPQNAERVKGGLSFSYGKVIVEYKPQKLY